MSDLSADERSELSSADLFRDLVDGNILMRLAARAMQQHTDQTDQTDQIPKWFRPSAESETLLVAVLDTSEPLCPLWQVCDRKTCRTREIWSPF